MQKHLCSFVLCCCRHCELFCGQVVGSSPGADRLRPASSSWERICSNLFFEVVSDFYFGLCLLYFSFYSARLCLLLSPSFGTSLAVRDASSLLQADPAAQTSTLLFGTSIASLEKWFAFAVSSSGVTPFTMVFKDLALFLLLTWSLFSWVT